MYTNIDYAIGLNLKKSTNYNICIKEILNQEFKRLKGTHFLDYAASSIYSEQQLSSIIKEFSESIYGNPHSRNLPSDIVTNGIDAIRLRVLQHFNVSEQDYDVIFTSGATSAIKLIGESLASKKSDNNGTCLKSFIYTQENHTSVVGLSEIFLNLNVSVECLQAKILFDTPLEKLDMPTQKSNEFGLFAYPAECNFSGSKYPLHWIKKVQEGVLNHVTRNGGKKNYKESDLQWYVLLDAACFAATSALDLTKWKPDFVPISFYKMFGYPTGLGCLLVSNRAQHLLQKTYFGGGTVQMIDPRTMTLFPRTSLHERFEDGTLNFLGILSLGAGFDTLKRIAGSMEVIEDHVFNLTNYLFHHLKSLNHSNHQPVVEIYSEDEVITKFNHGSILNFNILDSNGKYIGFNQVERVASLYNIYLRTGCVCNPGACQKYLNISSDKLLNHFQAGHTCGDAVDIVDGCPTGSVRVSFGYVSTYDDADAIIKMVRECFVKGKPIIDTNWVFDKANSSANKPLKTLPTSVISQRVTLQSDHLQETSFEIPFESRDVSSLYLKEIFIYPVKSCAGISVPKSTMGTSGLTFDRHWMIVTSSGVTVTLKRIPKLTLIQPAIDYSKRILTLSYKGFKDIEIPLDTKELEKSSDLGETSLCSGRVCGERVRGQSCGQGVSKWLSDVVGMEGLQLMRQVDHRKNKMAKTDSETGLSLANESQYLIIHDSSLTILKNLIENRGIESIHEDDLKLRFRPNFIIGGGFAYEEDTWQSLFIGQHEFQIHGKCTRCQMVSVDSNSGEKTKEPLVSLGQSRGTKMDFGVHASFVPPLNHSQSIVTTGIKITQKLH